MADQPAQSTLKTQAGLESKASDQTSYVVPKGQNPNGIAGMIGLTLEQVMSGIRNPSHNGLKLTALDKYYQRYNEPSQGIIIDLTDEFNQNNQNVDGISHENKKRSLPEETTLSEPLRQETKKSKSLQVVDLETYSSEPHVMLDNIQADTGLSSSQQMTEVRTNPEVSNSCSNMQGQEGVSENVFAQMVPESSFNDQYLQNGAQFGNYRSSSLNVGQSALMNGKRRQFSKMVARNQQRLPGQNTLASQTPPVRSVITNTQLNLAATPSAYTQLLSRQPNPEKLRNKQVIIEQFQNSPAAMFMPPQAMGVYNSGTYEAQRAKDTPYPFQNHPEQNTQSMSPCVASGSQAYQSRGPTMTSSYVPGFNAGPRFYGSSFDPSSMFHPQYYSPSSFTPSFVQHPQTQLLQSSTPEVQNGPYSQEFQIPPPIPKESMKNTFASPSARSHIQAVNFCDSATFNTSSQGLHLGFSPALTLESANCCSNVYNGFSSQTTQGLDRTNIQIPSQGLYPGLLNLESNHLTAMILEAQSDALQSCRSTIAPEKPSPCFNANLAPEVGEGFTALFGVGVSDLPPPNEPPTSRILLPKLSAYIDLTTDLEIDGHSTHVRQTAASTLGQIAPTSELTESFNTGYEHNSVFPAIQATFRETEECHIPEIGPHVDVQLNNQASAASHITMASENHTSHEEDYNSELQSYNGIPGPTVDDTDERGSGEYSLFSTVALDDEELFAMFLSSY